MSLLFALIIFGLIISGIYLSYKIFSIVFKTVEEDESSRHPNPAEMGVKIE